MLLTTTLSSEFGEDTYLCQMCQKKRRRGNNRKGKWEGETVGDLSQDWVVRHWEQ